MKQTNLFELNKEEQKMEIQKRSWVLIVRDLARSTGSGGVYIYDLICKLLKKIPAQLEKEYNKGLIGLHVYRNAKTGFALRFYKVEANVIFRRIIKFAKKTHKKHIKQEQHDDAQNN